MASNNKNYLQGYNMVLLIGGKVVAGCTDASLSYNKNEIDVSSKSSGKAVSRVYGKEDWSVSVSALVSLDTNVVSYTTLLEYAKNEEIVDVVLVPKTVESSVLNDTMAAISDTSTLQVSDATDGDFTGKFIQNAKYLRGQATIASVDLNTGDDIASYSTTLNAAGELQILTVAADS